MSRFGPWGKALIVLVAVILIASFLVSRVAMRRAGALPRDMGVFTAETGSISVEITGTAPLSADRRRTVSAAAAVGEITVAVGSQFCRDRVS